MMVIPIALLIQFFLSRRLRDRDEEEKNRRRKMVRQDNGCDKKTD